MKKELFSPMEIDAIGELMNISLGSSATAVSNMLDHRVDITTPKVTVVEVKDFSIGNLEPAMGVEIKYVEGLEGSNIMLLRRSDIKVIVDILMGSETPDEEFELNELTISAVCEVMNQMMGAASTAMSDFLGFPVNISTPEPFELEDLTAFKEGHLPKGADTIVVVRFSLKIENALESEFMNIMSVSLAKELLKGLGLDEEETEDAAQEVQAASVPPQSSGGDKQLSQEEIEKLIHGSQEDRPVNPPSPDTHSGSGKQLSQEEIERLITGGTGEESVPQPPASPSKQEPAQPMPGQKTECVPPPAGVRQEGGQMPESQMGYPPPAYYPPYPYPYPYPPQQMAAPPEPKVINAKPAPMLELDGIETLGKEQAQNLELIMEVPVQVTVEIGRTQRKVQDILEFSKGSLVVLDKLAGDQVDLFVNGKCIAKGDVVVIDDNFGVRITEIIQKTGAEKHEKK